VLSFVGVIVFAGLTAYDAQRLPLMAREAPAEGFSSYATSARWRCISIS
jgi:FtsH-binding integral membrane protein